MICPKCSKETPMQKSFCQHCGGLIEVGFEEVQEAMEGENLREAQDAFQRRLYFWLATALAVLVAALTFRLSHLEADLPRFDEVPVLQVLDVEKAPVFPPPEIPALALPLPGTEAKAP